MSSTESAGTGDVISTDYLVLGAGVSGLGFVDELLTRTDATITITDKRDAPGGQWNDAYPFVKLHGPAIMYGVESKPIIEYEIEQNGLNKGYLRLASGPEILAHCSTLMRDRFLASGRVTYLPSTEYVESEGIVRGVFSAKTWKVDVKKKIVDARYCENVIPSTHTRSFSTAASVTCIAPNELPRLAPKFEYFTVMGAGKTGVDSCIWLLNNGVPPSRIRWIVPNDYWYLDRSTSQFEMPFFDQTIQLVIDRFETTAQATDALDFAHRMEKCGIWRRVDPEVEPYHYHSAVISTGELSELRKLENIVREGYVSAIETDKVVLTKGTVPAHPSTLYIDCTASAYTNPGLTPIYQEKKIILQLVRSVMPSLSVAILAFLESLDMSDEERNNLVVPIPYAKTTSGYLSEWALDLQNRFRLSQNPDTSRWLMQSRLDVIARLVRQVPTDDTEKRAKLGQLQKALLAAGANLPKLVASTNNKDESRL